MKHNKLKSKMGWTIKLCAKFKVANLFYKIYVDDG